MMGTRRFLGTVLRRFIHDPDFGRCLSCGWPFTLASEHYVTFGPDGESIAMCCTVCWRRLDLGMRLVYAYMGVHGTGTGWRAGECWDHADGAWPLIRRAIHAEKDRTSTGGDRP